MTAGRSIRSRGPGVTRMLKVEISPAVKWQKARAGIEELRRLLAPEVIHLAQNCDIQNAYCRLRG